MTLMKRSVFLKDAGLWPTTFRNTYADKMTPGNETNIHVACRAGLDQNRLPPHRVLPDGYWSTVMMLVESAYPA